MTDEQVTKITDLLLIIACELAAIFGAVVISGVRPFR